MTQFDDRRAASETKFSKDQEYMFRLEARACKLLGLWAAEQLGITGDDALAYAKTLIAANLDEPGHDDVKRQVVADFAEKGINLDHDTLDAALNRCIAEAEKQLDAEAKAG
jgi:hypothetical protein